MQDFHYNYIKHEYDDKAEMFLTDTDSLMYKTEAENVYDVFYIAKDLLYFINYPRDSKYYNNENNLVAGKVKDETCGVSIKGLLELKSKIYNFITKDNHESKKSKQNMKITRMFCSLDHILDTQ